jgi:DTW domain-containing protein YfiP
LPLVDLCLFGSTKTSSDDLQSDKEFVMKTVVGRGFGPDRDAAIINILNDPEQVIVMVFPHQTAMDFERGIKLAEERCGFNTHEENGTTITLLFLDATWKHAREMDAKISKTLNCHHWIRVQLLPSKLNCCGGTDQTADSANTKADTEVCFGNAQNNTQTPFIQRRFQIRAPPSPNHLSTAECLAWVASRIEQNPEIFETIAKVLDYMVILWRGSVVSEEEKGSEQGWDMMSQKPLEIKHN